MNQGAKEVQTMCFKGSFEYFGVLGGVFGALLKHVGSKLKNGLYCDMLARSGVQ